MISCQIITVITLFLSCSAFEIPKFLRCCSNEWDVVYYHDGNNVSCRSDWYTYPLTLTCNTYRIIQYEYFDYTITYSGRVFFNYPGASKSQEIYRGRVCFANETFKDAEAEVVVFCTDYYEDDVQDVIGYRMLVSAVFFLLVTVIYAALPEVRDVQGKSIINFCGSMGIGLAILSASKLTTYSDMTLCGIRGFLVYFFLMASYFWINAISIQVLLILRRPTVNNYGRKELYWYALYAWGCSTVLTLGMAIVNVHTGDNDYPDIGLKTCWFHNTTQQWYYMYSVMAILILVNICIYLYTSVLLWRRSFSSSQIKELKYKYLVAFRIFVVTGITWVFETMSPLTENNIIWYHIIGVFTTLQGPLIFLLLVVFRTRVVRAFIKRGVLPCLARPSERDVAARDDDEIQQTDDVTMNEKNVMEETKVET